MNHNRFLTLVLTFLASLFLYFSFPNFLNIFGLWPLAWVGLVPLFIALDNQPGRERFKIGVLFSFLFFALLVSWLLPLNFLGYLGFVLILMISPVLFAVLFISPFKNKWISLIYCPALWVATEMLRTMMLGGFSWTLGHSQAFQISIIQIASITGSYGISFFLVLFNYCLYRILKHDTDQYVHAAIAVFSILIVLSYGYSVMTNGSSKEGTSSLYQICSIQPNIASQDKWDEHLIDRIIERHIFLTQEAMRSYSPDIVVWPETSIPDDFIKDMTLRDQVSQIATRVKTHLLLGAALSENGYDYNCAVLLNGRGAVLDIYRKQYLVPFSENSPGKRLLEFLHLSRNRDTYDFHAGKSLGLFTLRKKESTGKIIEQNIGITICSEGFYPELFRKLVQKGSGFVILLLNNGWFKQEATMIIHAQSEIMRSVENHVPIIRSANTGWSCMIEKDGRVKNLTGTPPYLNKAGFYLFEMVPNHEITFYNQYGDIFAVSCLGFVIIIFIIKGIVVQRFKNF